LIERRLSDRHARASTAGAEAVVVVGLVVVVGATVVVGALVVVVGLTVVVGATVVVGESVVEGAVVPAGKLHEYERRTIRHCNPGSTVTVTQPLGHRLLYVRRVLSVAREQSTGPLAADRQPAGHAAAKYCR